ncbi:hypothetical protein BDF14DRAFT_434288 [Spinellus fusiger]|nr:hypothetical protein BDF14DRAFT_434288 [Spinellus fusiger]
MQRLKDYGIIVEPLPEVVVYSEYRKELTEKEQETLSHHQGQRAKKEVIIGHGPFFNVQCVMTMGGCSSHNPLFIRKSSSENTKSAKLTHQPKESRLFHTLFKRRQNRLLFKRERLPQVLFSQQQRNRTPSLHPSITGTQQVHLPSVRLSVHPFSCRSQHVLICHQRLSFFLTL